MADAAMDAAGDAMPKATADTMMAALMVEAGQIDSPTPDMRAYGRCVGISDYMTAHSTAKDRGDWAKDSRKLEASAEAMPDYNAGVFSSERENTLFKMAEACGRCRLIPMGLSRKRAAKPWHAISPPASSSRRNAAALTAKTRSSRAARASPPSPPAAFRPPQPLPPRPARRLRGGGRACPKLYRISPPCILRRARHLSPYEQTERQPRHAV